MKERNFYKIGINLERALQDKNVSVTQLSKLTGIQPVLLRRYIMNDKSPSFAAIEKISKVLNKDPDYFISDSFFKEDEMRVHALKYDLMVNFDENDEKSVRKCYSAIEKMNRQIFNSLTFEGKKKIFKILYTTLTTEIYKLLK